MTNTGNRRRRERATRNRADSILAEAWPYADLASAYDGLRELLAGHAEGVEPLRALARRHAAPDAATVSAILEASRAPRAIPLPDRVELPAEPEVVYVRPARSLGLPVEQVLVSRYYADAFRAAGLLEEDS